MPKQFPPSMITAAQEPYVKMAFLADPEVLAAGGCKNCGGLGTFILFLASEGPYQIPMPKKDKVAHFYNGRWWLGKNYEFECPVCHGLGFPKDGDQPEYVPPPAPEPSEQIELLAQHLEMPS